MRRSYQPHLRAEMNKLRGEVSVPGPDYSRRYRFDSGLHPKSEYFVRSPNLGSREKMDSFEKSSNVLSGDLIITPDIINIQVPEQTLPMTMSMKPHRTIKVYKKKRNAHMNEVL